MSDTFNVTIQTEPRQFNVSVDGQTHTFNVTLEHGTSWGSITGKPTVFAPAPHEHPELVLLINEKASQVDLDTLQGKVDSKADSDHTHSYNDLTDKPTFSASWNDITDKPTSFPPSVHTHDYATLTGIPSSFTPSAHQHPLSDIPEMASTVYQVGLNTSAIADLQINKADKTTLSTLRTDFDGFVTDQSAKDNAQDGLIAGKASSQELLALAQTVSGLPNTAYVQTAAQLQAGTYNSFGFADPSAVQVTWTNNLNDVTLTVAPKSPATNFKVYVGNQLYTFTSLVKTSTLPLGTTYYYVDSSGTLQASTVLPDITQVAMVFALNWNNNSGARYAVLDQWEVHGCDYPVAVKRNGHLTSGAKWVTGNGFNLIANKTNGTPNVDGRNSVIGMIAGSFMDEDDLVTTVNSTLAGKWQQDHGAQTVGALALATGAQIPVTYSNGTTGFVKTTNGKFPFLFSSNTPWYFNGTNEVAVPDGNRFVYWVIVTKSQTNPIRLVPHRATYNTLAQAQAGASITAFANDMTGLDTQELICAWRIIFQHKTGWGITAVKNTSIEDFTDFRAVQQALIAGAVIPQAGAIAVTPTGNFTSTNVQALATEIDTKTAKLSGPNTFDTRPTTSDVSVPSASSLIAGRDYTARRMWSQIAERWLYGSLSGGLNGGSGTAVAQSVQGNAGVLANGKGFGLHQSGMTYQSGAGAAIYYENQFSISGYLSSQCVHGVSTITTTSGSTTATLVSGTPSSGMQLYGNPNIPNGTAVTVSGTTITLSRPATGSGTAVSTTHSFNVKSRYVLGTPYATTTFNFQCPSCSGSFIMNAVGTTAVGSNTLVVTPIATGVCNWTAGNTYLTIPAGHNSIGVNQLVTGVGIPLNTVVAAWNSTTKVVDLKNAITNLPVTLPANGTSVTCGFFPTSIATPTITGGSSRLYCEGLDNSTTALTAEANSTSDNYVKLNLSKPTIAAIPAGSEVCYGLTSVAPTASNNCLGFEQVVDPATGQYKWRIFAMIAGDLFYSALAVPAGQDGRYYAPYFQFVLDYKSSTKTARLFMVRGANQSLADYEALPTVPIATLTLATDLSGRMGAIHSGVQCLNAPDYPATVSSITGIQLIDAKYFPFNAYPY